jgi:hypothetical protein
MVGGWYTQGGLTARTLRESTSNASRLPLKSVDFQEE